MADKEKKDSFFKKIGKFFKSLAAEMKKVSWPSRKQLTTSTVSVIVYCVLIGALIAILDVVVGTLLINKLLGLG